MLTEGLKVDCSQKCLMPRPGVVMLKLKPNFKVYQLTCYKIIAVLRPV